MKLKQKKLNTLLVTSFFAFSYFVIAGQIFGADGAAPVYTPLVGIPGLTNQSTASLPDYLNKVYFLTITIGALFGVVKIAFAGVKYSMSDVITSKESAKEDIKGVLLGLAILLIPTVVLETINPNLTKLDVLEIMRENQIQTKTLPKESTKTVVNNGDKVAVGTKTSDLPAGKQMTHCNYQPRRGVGGCWTETQQMSNTCQIEKAKCEEECIKKSGSIKDLQNGTSGVIECISDGEYYDP